MPYRVRFADQSWMVEDLTLDEACILERDLRKNWYQLSPLTSAQDCRGVIIAFLSREMDPTAAAEKVGQIPIGKILDHIEVVAADDLPTMYQDGIPLAAGDQETGGLSPAPDGSGGPPT